ncbi:MAG: RNA polymerase sigma factor [Ignavibacteriae bacterium]|nr:RNA polymerase sigma factor [Ignavibacteriota bacterium]
MEPAPQAQTHTVERQLVGDFLVARDAQSFHQLYQYATPYLYQFILRLIGGNENDAQDILQDVWIRAVERLAEFRWESSLRTWISGIAVNRCREFFRQRAKSQVGVSDEEFGMPFTVDSPSQRIDLEDAIARLPHGFRAVLVLHDIEGWTHEEIAVLLEIEPGTSKSQLSRARKAVRHMLSED